METGAHAQCHAKLMHGSAHTYTRAHVVSLCFSFDNNIMCVRVFTRALRVQLQGQAHMLTNARAPMAHKQVGVPDVHLLATVTTACAKRTGAAACAERMRRELDRAISPESLARQVVAHGSASSLSARTHHHPYKQAHSHTYVRVRTRIHKCK